MRRKLTKAKSVHNLSTYQENYDLKNVTELTVPLFLEQRCEYEDNRLKIGVLDHVRQLLHEELELSGDEEEEEELLYDEEEV